MKKIISNLFYKTIFHNHDMNNIKIKSIKSRQFPYKVEIIAENLNVPWAIDISNNDNIYFTERFGSIRIIENGKLNPQPLITFGYPISFKNKIHLYNNKPYNLLVIRFITYINIFSI